MQNFELVVPGGYPQQRIEVPNLSEDALKEILRRLQLLGVQSMPGSTNDDLILTSTEHLQANTTYMGVPMFTELPMNTLVRIMLC